MSLKMYHNPRCSKSRQTLALLEENGVTPELVLYLESQPTVAELESVLQKLGLEPTAMFRFKESLAKELGISKSDERSAHEWMELLADNIKLLERPIVVTDKAAAIGRPPEQVLALLG